MKVVYQGRADAVQVGKVIATRGEPVDLPAAIANPLLASGVWSKHQSPEPDEGATTTEGDQS